MDSGPQLVLPLNQLRNNFDRHMVRAVTDPDTAHGTKSVLWWIMNKIATTCSKSLKKLKVRFSSSVFQQFPGQGFGWEERNKSEAGVSRRRMWAGLGCRESDPPTSGHGCHTGVCRANHRKGDGRNVVETTSCT